MGDRAGDESNDVTDQDIMEMKYIDQIFSEATRFQLLIIFDFFMA